MPVPAWFFSVFRSTTIRVNIPEIVLLCIQFGFLVTCQTLLARVYFFLFFFHSFMRFFHLNPNDNVINSRVQYHVDTVMYVYSPTIMWCATNDPVLHLFLLQHFFFLVLFYVCRYVAYLYLEQWVEIQTLTYMYYSDYDDSSDDGVGFDNNVVDGVFDDAEDPSGGNEVFEAWQRCHFCKNVNEECAICCNSEGGSTPFVVVENCQHYFHCKCMVSYLTSHPPLPPRCPLCRTVI
jgi:hypothetical protein